MYTIILNSIIFSASIYGVYSFYSNNNKFIHFVNRLQSNLIKDNIIKLNKDINRFNIILKFIEELNVSHNKLKPEDSKIISPFTIRQILNNEYYGFIMIGTDLNNQTLANNTKEKINKAFFKLNELDNIFNDKIFKNKLQSSKIKKTNDANCHLFYIFIKKYTKDLNDTYQSYDYLLTLYSEYVNKIAKNKIKF